MSAAAASASAPLHVLITGAGGWLGSLLPAFVAEVHHAAGAAASQRALRFVLVDIAEPKVPAFASLPAGAPTPQVRTRKLDLTDAAHVDGLFTSDWGRCGQRGRCAHPPR